MRRYDGPSGMGLDVAICKMILEQHNGQISIAPVHLTAWRFAVMLPASPDYAHTSVRSDDLSGFDVDKDVLLALVRCLDLDHIDILAFLPLNREIGGLAGRFR